jgi:dihydrofolate synthase/folylpolyglutamate synthase
MRDKMNRYEDTLTYLFGLYRFGSRPGLGPIRKVLKKLGNPERGLKVIHVAGTNGKGSVCAVLSSVLKEGGYRVGMYTSPHLVDFRERIQVNGRMISKNDVIRLFKLVKSKNVELTYFEFVTALAFKYFMERKVDILVCEVGLGGRLDATNVVRPLVSVITNISKEHTDVLGSEIRQIAFEKAGIIKRNSLAVTNAKGEALEVIKKTCRDKRSELIMVKKNARKISSGLDKQKVVYKNLQTDFPLLGDFQLENLNIALETIEQVRRFGFDPPMQKIRLGLEKTKWPGRIEIAGKKPLFILDGAHNPAGIRALKKFVEKLDYRRLILLTGMLEDKDYRRMIRYLKPLASKTIITKPRMYRALDPRVIGMHVKSNFVIRGEIKDALKEAGRLAKKDDAILVTGSIYLIGNVKEIL